MPPLSTRIAYIYSLVDPREPEIVRYIGKTELPAQRLNGHLLESAKRDGYKNHWIKSLVSESVLPRMEILRVVPWSDWQQWERALISQHRGPKLTNGNEGGVGGGIPEPWVRKKMSEAQHRSRKNPEVVAMYKLANQLKWLKPGYREHMVRVHTGKKQSPELIAQRITCQFGRIHSNEERLKRSISLTAIRGVPVTNLTTGESFKSLKSAGRSVNTPYTNIRRAARDGGTAAGHRWVFGKP